jgi:hypothetical protein
MVPGGLQVSLLVLKAAGGLFELEAQLIVARGTANREEFRVIPAAHIAQPKVPKPPHRGGASDFSAYKCINCSVLLNVRISSTIVHWILIQFKKHFKLVLFLGIRTGTSES